MNSASSIDKNDRFLNISVKDNLSLVNDNFERIVYVCKKLGIHDDISQLKNGYDTILNSNEDTLKPNTKVMLNIDVCKFLYVIFSLTHLFLLLLVFEGVLIVALWVVLLKF